MTKASSESKPRRRWLTFSLRTLLVVMLIFGVSIGWVTKKARDQRRAVAEIETLGGLVTYDVWPVVDYTWPTGLPNGSRIRDVSPPKPIWLRRLVGHHYFDTVNGVYFIGEDAHCSSEAFAAISQLKQIEELIILEGDVTDRVLTHLTDLPKLENLEIEGAAITDEGIAVLHQLTSLKTLQIGAPITDNSVSTLKKMTHLGTLRLWDTSISEEGAEELRKSMRGTEIDVLRARGHTGSSRPDNARACGGPA